MEETFTYDDMNRLTGITLKRSSGQDLTCAVTYDALGRMTSRQAVTAVNLVPQVTQVFSQPVFDATKVHALASATTTSGVFPTTPQTITYTGFDKVSKVKQGTDSICYTYGYDRQRIYMEEHVGNTTRTKRYVGSCEYQTETTGNATNSRWLTYLSCPTGVYAVVVTENNTHTVHYVLKDNLGSWTTITNATGTVEQQLSYDAWGNLRNPITWANYRAGDTYDGPMFDRGYTGHEHVEAFGLINMNGRMYDPVMGGFLSVDRFVQNPLTAQGFNRYSYCMNNPLRFVDPTGWEPGPGGGNGDGPYLPGAPYYVDGMLTVDLPEIIIMPDNPSLSNRKEAVTYNTYYYGGERLNLSWTSNSEGQSVGPNSGGCGGGSGSHGGRQSMDIAAGVLATMWGVSVVEPTPAGEVVTGVASIAATIYFGKELYDKMKAEIAHLLTRPDGPDGFVYELRANTDGLYPCVRTSTWVYLEANEVWKIGETTQLDGGRYSKELLQSIGAGGVTPYPVFYGNQREIKIQEKILIYGYYFKHGFLPPGNKIFR